MEPPRNVSKNQKSSDKLIKLLCSRSWSLHYSPFHPFAVPWVLILREQWVSRSYRYNSFLFRSHLGSSNVIHIVSLLVLGQLSLVVSQIFIEESDWGRALDILDIIHEIWDIRHRGNLWLTLIYRSYLPHLIVLIDHIISRFQRVSLPGRDMLHPVQIDILHVQSILPLDIRFESLFNLLFNVVPYFFGWFSLSPFYILNEMEITSALIESRIKLGVSYGKYSTTGSLQKGSRGLVVLVHLNFLIALVPTISSLFNLLSSTFSTLAGLVVDPSMSSFLLMYDYFCGGRLLTNRDWAPSISVTSLVVWWQDVLGLLERCQRVLRYMVLSLLGNFQLQSSGYVVESGCIMKCSNNNYQKLLAGTLTETVLHGSRLVFHLEPLHPWLNCILPILIKSPKSSSHKSSNYSKQQYYIKREIPTHSYSILTSPSTFVSFSPSFSWSSTSVVPISFHLHFLSDFTNLPCSLFLFSANSFLTLYFTFFHFLFFFFYRYFVTFYFLQNSVIGPMNFIGVPYGATREERYWLLQKSFQKEKLGMWSKADMWNLAIKVLKSTVSGKIPRDFVSPQFILMGMGMVISLLQLGSESLVSVILSLLMPIELVELESS